MMFDIDFFKKINDTYGHLAGDRIIYGISRIIDSKIRTEDVAARFGGEEFVVLLVNCNAEYAYEIAERMRAEIQDYEFIFEEKKIKATVSIGVCTTNTKEFYSSTQLLNNADCALYHSKENGRNKTTIFNGNIAMNCEK
jgi:diguanylate cyclase (GGDEF)-like protein